MKTRNKETKSSHPIKKDGNEGDDALSYPSDEDIYNQSKELSNVDPENVSKKKRTDRNIEEGVNNELDFTDDRSGDDLDVPGAELDDKEEKNGNEDEENNYYSLGGDDHQDLEEDKGE